MIEYRPVDCDTQQPLPFSPAYIDKSTIYRGGPRPGWSWFPQSASDATLITPSRERPPEGSHTEWVFWADKAYMHPASSLLTMRIAYS